MRVGTATDLVRSIVSWLAALAAPAPSFSAMGGSARMLAEVRSALRYLSLHTGVPALVLAAVVVCVGYRVLKRTARFAIEVAAVALVLVAASEMGWIRW